MRSSCSLVALATMFFSPCLYAQQGEEDHVRNKDHERHRAPYDGSHATSQSEGPESPEIIPMRRRATGLKGASAGTTASMSPAIKYHGGPIIVTPNVYLIWYGNWDQPNDGDTPMGQQIIRNFLYGLSNSNYYQTNTSYYGYDGQVSGSFFVAGESSDDYSHGNSLSDADVLDVVRTAIGSRDPDSDGIYFVLTSTDVAETSGFGSRYCGWHTSSTVSPTSHIRYAFVGNPGRFMNGCAAQNVGPNGNPSVDGMVSILAHELEETNTDPDVNAWYNAKGSEDADMCAWTFGAQQRDDNGAYYNMSLPGSDGVYHNYLVQRQLAADSKCYVDYVNKIQ